MSQTLRNKLHAYISINLFILFFASNSFAQTPVITSVSPNPVCQGNVVTITGTGFAGATVVQLGSLKASGISVNDDKTITAYVDSNATSGNVQVTTPKGSSNTQIITIKPSEGFFMYK